MKHTKLLVVALLVALLACLAVTAMADDEPCQHYYTTQTVMTPATCETEGILAIKCANPDCDYVRYESLPALGHKWPDYPTVVKQPSCGDTGRAEYACTRTVTLSDGTEWKCSHVRKVDIPATGNHDFSVVADEGKPATCVANGLSKTYKCRVCNKIKAEPTVIPATGHSFTQNQWTVKVAATCGRDGILERKCDKCDYKETQNVGKTAYHTDTNYANAYTKVTYSDTAATTIAPVGTYILEGRAPTCTADGCGYVFQCKDCGETKGGEVIKAPGHNLNGATWDVEVGATCATDGILVRKCLRCGGKIERQNVGKLSTHDANYENYNALKTSTLTGAEAKAKGIILPASPRTCESDGCYAVVQCSICGKTIGGGKWSASGHNIPVNSWKNDPAPTCTTKGYSVGTCQNAWCDYADKKVYVELPAFGHSASWKITEWPSDTKTGVAELICSRCGKTIGMQIVKKGDAYPTGTVNTGVTTASSPSVTGSTAAAHEASNTVTKTSTAKSTTKTSTAKSTTKTSTAKTSTSSTKAAAAPATTETKKVATVAAVVAAPAALAENQAQLVADKHLYVVKNVAGEEIVLTVNVVDGKITVEANLAEGESLVLYANAEAIDAPSAENTLVLTANEAVELPEAFQNAIVAVVKTESLPAAVAAK